MIPLAAYADRLSVRPGETIRFHVANDSGQSVTAQLARVICADANPAGPGIRTEPVAQPPTVLQPPQPERVPRGSFVRTTELPGSTITGSFSVAVRVCPGLFNGRDQALVSCIGADSDHGIVLGIDGEGHAYMQLGSTSGTTQRMGLEQPLRINQWALIWMSVDRDGSRIRLGRSAITGGLSDPGPDRVRQEPLTVDPGWPTAPILLGALNHRQPTAHFNGRLESPLIMDRHLGDMEITGLTRGEWPDEPTIRWDLAQEMSSSRVVDVGPHGLHGHTVNCPVRAVRASGWTGREMCWRHEPSHYGALHLHEDDLDDCAWPACYEWTVPEDTDCACYALFLSAGDASDNVPFFVVAKRGQPKAKLAVLVSTFTYTVYGNHLRKEWLSDPDWKAAWQRQARDWGAYPHNPGEHAEYGLSTYNDHPDRSGISIASWHRPMFNVRVGYITYPYPDLRGSGLRHLPADSHLLCWLERKGIAFDLVSDWELHTEGVSALQDYQVVMTGSHPEYHTPDSLDALQAYRDGGGRLCYLGGNGFYWKVALSPERDGVIEIRRAEGGIRAWAAEPGEYYNQFDGEYGGLWRRNGRPPQRLAGVGFTAQGNFLGSFYRKTAAASDPRVAWMFEGVDGDVLGDHGLSGHGAAGFELDRVDIRLGSPLHTVVVASSENHPPDAPWVLVPEESLTHITTWPGEPAAELIRADMSFFETPAGGAVFSTGSITFCGSLLTDEQDNDVSRLVQNVIARFLDPTSFQMPEDR